MARGAEEYVVVPEGWLSRGEAFVRGDHAQLAVFGGIPGERVRVRVIEQNGHQVRARVVKLMGPASPARVEPSCDRFIPCGRCPLMHLSPEGQQAARHDVLRHAFSEARQALPASGIDPVVRVESTVQHAVELIAGWSDDRHPRIGAPGRDGRHVVAIPHCIVASDALRAVMSATAHHVRELKIWPWEKGRGNLRGFFVRQSAKSGEILLTLSFGRSTNFAKQLAEAVAAEVPQMAGVFAHWNDEPGPMFAPSEETGEPEVSLVYGRAGAEEAFGGERFRLGALDPFPAYPAAAAAAWEALLGLIAPEPGDAVLDLGSGSGLRTLPLARRTGWALGVDPREGVVRRARENAALAGVSAEFVVGTLAEGIEAVQPRLVGRRPLVVAEPGLKGFDTETIDGLRAVDPRRVVLVSTNPRALARDVGRLVASGLRFERLVPTDSVPLTPFGETYALLASADASLPTLRAPRRRALRG